jgi:hypothetical protein
MLLQRVPQTADWMVVQTVVQMVVLLAVSKDYQMIVLLVHHKADWTAGWKAVQTVSLSQGQYSEMICGSPELQQAPETQTAPPLAAQRHQPTSLTDPRSSTPFASPV